MLPRLVEAARRLLRARARRPGWSPTPPLRNGTGLRFRTRWPIGCHGSCERDDGPVLAGGAGEQLCLHGDRMEWEIVDAVTHFGLASRAHEQIAKSHSPVRATDEDGLVPRPMASGGTTKDAGMISASPFRGMAQPQIAYEAQLRLVIAATGAGGTRGHSPTPPAGPRTSLWGRRATHSAAGSTAAWVIVEMAGPRPHRPIRIDPAASRAGRIHGPS